MKVPLKIPRRWPIYSSVGIILLLSLYTIVGERGAIHLWRLREEKSALDEQNYRLQIDNESLRARIVRLRSDALYLEKIAREELNLVRPGEIIYRFPATEPVKNRPRALGDLSPVSRPSKGQKQHR